MAFTLSTIYKAIDKFSPVIKTMEKANQNFALSQDKMLGRIGNKMSNLRDQLIGLAGGLSIASLFLMGGSAIVKFDDSIASLSAVTGVTGRELGSMKKEVMDLANKSKIAGYDIAKGFEIVGSAMSQYLKDPKSLRLITEAGVTLSKAARMEMEPTLNSLTTVMNQFMLKATQAKKTVDILTAGEIVGSVRTTEIASSLQEFGAVAYTANVKLTESVALIEALGKQMEISKIGVGARNLITTINAAKGLDKEAVKQLQANRVNTTLLMDSKTNLGTKLKELSKIQNDNIAMVKVFGKENLTAAKVIFNQLPTYEAYLKEIEKTEKAQEQAGINSASFANRIKQLRARFENLIISGNESSGMLNRFGKVVGFVEKHLGGILITIGLTIGAMITYYTLMTSVRVAMVAYNIVLGITKALQGASAFSVWGNVVAYRAFRAAVVTATAAQWLWNAALYANPIVLLVMAILAAIAIVVVMIVKWKELTAWFEKSAGWVKILVFALLNGFIAVAFVIRKVIDNWNGLVKVFKENGFIQGIIAVGKVILSMILAPIQMILKFIGIITGAKWASKAAESIDKFRTDLEAETNVNQEKPVNIQKANNEAQTSRYEEITMNKLQIELANKSDKKANIKSSPSLIPLISTTN